jgi:hypothetical protein
VSLIQNNSKHLVGSMKNEHNQPIGSCVPCCKDDQYYIITCGHVIYDNNYENLITKLENIKIDIDGENYISTELIGDISISQQTDLAILRVSPVSAADTIPEFMELAFSSSPKESKFFKKSSLCLLPYGDEVDAVVTVSKFKRVSGQYSYTIEVDKGVFHKINMGSEGASAFKGISGSGLFFEHEQRIYLYGILAQLPKSSVERPLKMVNPEALKLFWDNIIFSENVGEVTKLFTNSLLHDGTGDIVADKFPTIIQSIQTRDLKSAIDIIMLDICYRNTDLAKEKLIAIKSIDSLESDVKSLLNALEVKIEITLKTSVPEKRELLNALRNTDLPVYIHEVIASILLDLESRTNAKVARERYNNLSSKGAYVEEVFFEKLASKEEISNSFSSLKFNLLEREVAGLIRGALRFESFSLAVEISNYLNENFPSTNSIALLVFTESCLVLTQNNDKHYLSLDKSSKNKIERLTSQVSHYLESVDDKRYIYALIHLLKITYFSNYKLLDLANKHIDKIRIVDELFAEQLKPKSITTLYSKNNFNSKSYILDEDGFADLNASLESNQVQISIVKNWLNNGGGIQVGNDYQNSFVELLLLALTCEDKNKGEVELLNSKTQHFYELDPIKFSSLNPALILKLCNRLIELKLFIHAIAYLKPWVSADTWVSPIFECYLNALFYGEKFDLFLSQLDSINTDDKTEIIWLLEAQFYSRIKNESLAIDAVRSAINIFPNNSYSWYLLLFILRDTGATSKTIKDALFEIPEDIFSDFHESKLGLLNEIYCFVDSNFADRVLIDWFVKNPVKLSIPFSTIHHNSILNNTERKGGVYTAKHCCDGVTYYDGFEEFTKILVRGIDVNHPSLLDVESPTGKLLDGLEVGETIQGIKLISRLPPYTAAYQLALRIRNSSNDGTDIFKMFSVPSNPEDLIPYMEKILKHYSPDNVKENSALQNPNLPLVVKGYYTDKGSPVKGALTHLLTKESAENIKLFNGGIELPQKVIIDSYTAVYFSLIGLVSSFEKLSIDVVLSKQTQLTLNLWLNDVLRDDYLSLDISEKGLHRFTAKDIKRDLSGVIQGLQKLLILSRVEELKLADTPDNLLRIKDVIDDDVYSTMQLSIANNIPLLCVDNIMCSAAHHSNYPVVNINTLLIRMLESKTLEKKRGGIQLNLFNGTPLPIFYDDIVKLSVSSEDIDVHMVAMFLKKYPISFDSQDVSLKFLVTILSNVTANAFERGKTMSLGTNTPCSDGFVEQVFNACCGNAIRVLAGKTAEKRLGLLIFGVLRNNFRVKGYVRLILNLSTLFAKGHFLDIKEVSDSFYGYIIKTSST